MTTTVATRTFQIDKAHSEAVFQVRHLITKVRGRFSDFEGTITFDDAAPVMTVKASRRRSASVTCSSAAERNSSKPRIIAFHPARFLVGRERLVPGCEIIL